MNVLIKYGVAPPLLLLINSGGDAEHLTGMETSFPQGAILDMQDVSYVELLCY